MASIIIADIRHRAQAVGFGLQWCSNGGRTYRVVRLVKPMADINVYIRNYWGKARSASCVPWHPLAYHSLDVAAAMSSLLDIRPGWLSQIARACALPQDEIRRRLVLAAALHDIGKFAPNFQMKVPDLYAELTKNPETATSGKGHGEIGAGMWCRWKFHPPLVGLTNWVNAAVAHHGAPVAISAAIENAISQKGQADADARAFVTAVTNLIGAPNSEEPGKGGAMIWCVAGLVILADWIGSNQDWFGYTKPTLSLPDYWRRAQDQARVAVREAQLSECAPAVHFTLETFLGSGAVPSPLQAWAETQSPRDEPSLYIVEDLTGAGKTEAALILAHRLMQAGAADGLYWALPTMATANGLYARLEHSYRRLFAGDAGHSLVLAHGARDLHGGFQASIGRAGIGRYGREDEPENVSAEASCAAFIAEDRKKTFLAQVGIGTLDQALLAVLPTRHQSLRLAALSRRVLIVDEAHSYDPYMAKGLETLLAFHRALGGSAIVLSATLTGAQREKLAKIYRPGRAARTTETAFPLVTHVTADGVAEAPQTSLRGTRRDLPVRRFETPETAMDALLEGARGGACGVYIRNTVKDALAAVAYLKANAAPGVRVDLFHARFALVDRMARESAVLARFGKASTPAERAGQILVATQVVEQSLDLDFDFMATDLCPMDLLIQRAGRLHRHDHRPRRSAAALWVVGPDAVDDAAANWYAAAFPVAQYVYAHPGQLWSTMRVLTEKGGLNLASASPRDLIEPVFGAEAAAYPPALDQGSTRAEAKDQSARAIATLNVLKPNNFTRDGGAWDSDTRTPTRLGDPTITLRLARWTNGTLQPWLESESESDYRAWRLSEISVRALRVAETVPPDHAAAKAIKAAQDNWPGRTVPPPILALTPTAMDGVWEGAWQDKDGRRQSVRYSAATGLLAR